MKLGTLLHAFAAMLALGLGGGCNLLLGNVEKTYEPARGGAGSGGAGSGGIGGSGTGGSGAAFLGNQSCDPGVSIPGGGDGLVLWLRGENLAGAPGKPVASWTDARCKGVVTQPEVASQPTIVVDQASGLPMARLDGIDDWLDIGPDTGPFDQGLTLVLVMRYREHGGAFVQLTNDGSNDVISIQNHPWNGLALRARNANGTSQFHAWTRVAEAQRLEVITVVIDGGSASVFKNGIANDSENPQSITPLPAVHRNHNFIGRDLGGDAFSGFDLAEMLLYSRALGPEERAAVDSSMISKWRVCEDPASFAENPLDCGSCGNTCSAGQACTAGSCVAAGADVSCPDRFSVDGAAVQVCTGRADWIRALHHCQSIYGRLFAPSNGVEAELLRAAIGAGAYVGVTDIGTEGTFTAPDGSPHPYQSWAAGQPDGSIGKQCAMVTKEGGWLAVECGQEEAAQWACIDDSKVTCYPRFVNGTRYEPCQAWIGYVTYEDRRSLCKSRGAKLAHVEDDTENDGIRQLVGLGDWLLIDANDTTVEGVFLDADEKPLTYARWHGGSPAAAGNDEDKDCVGVDMNGEWWALPCGDALRTTLCEYEGPAQPSCADLVPPDEPYTFPDFVVTDGSIDGGGPTAVLSPGQPFTYDYSFTLDGSACATCITQVITGYFPGPLSAECDYNGVPGTKPVSKIIHDQMVAPLVPGIYDLRSVMEQAAGCVQQFGVFLHRGTGARICVK